jgi:pyruvate ferredoxin oxidoreductase gamma subunit/2-oxoisovalerate ferredoxin oxidoreductase gamma subunit
MIEVRLHGRGGQGAVIGATILAQAAMREGKYAHAFPLFGAERRGAPVQAFLRVDTKYIYQRDIVESPDHVIVLNPLLIKTKMAQVDKGLKRGGRVLINSSEDPKTFQFPQHYSVSTVDAGSIAIRHGLGSVQDPIVNTAILGAFVKLVDLVSLDSLFHAIELEVPTKKEANVAAARETYDRVSVSV